MLGLGWGEMIVIMVIVALVFGGSRLPELGRGLGEGMRGFRDALRGEPRPDTSPPGEVGRPAGGQATAKPSCLEPVPKGWTEPSRRLRARCKARMQPHTGGMGQMSNAAAGAQAAAWRQEPFRDWLLRFPAGQLGLGRVYLGRLGPPGPHSARPARRPSACRGAWPVWVCIGSPRPRLPLPLFWPSGRVRLSFRPQLASLASGPGPSPAGASTGHATGRPTLGAYEVSDSPRGVLDRASVGAQAVASRQFWEKKHPASLFSLTGQGRTCRNLSQRGGNLRGSPRSWVFEN